MSTSANLPDRDEAGAFQEKLDTAAKRRSSECIHRPPPFHSPHGFTCVKCRCWVPLIEAE